MVIRAEVTAMISQFPQDLIFAKSQKTVIRIGWLVAINLAGFCGFRSLTPMQFNASLGQ